MPDVNESRVWAIVLMLLASFASASAYLLVRELTHINARLDRITDFVLEDRKELHLPERGRNDR